MTEDDVVEFATKISIVVAEDLLTWQKLNVIAFLSSGVTGQVENLLGEAYVDASEQEYARLCVQPMVILKSTRERLQTFLGRANRRGLQAAVYIEDMFATGHDATNREAVRSYTSDTLPLVGLALCGDRKEIDKIFKDSSLAKMHQAGIGDAFLDFLNSYLSPRIGHVTIEGAMSEAFEISDSIFQGEGWL